ncbi:four helix bundle protein [Candidatus Parcubacteria bacterium]|nr:four helix bundle protein [Patescibacteria group bacterium]MCG2690675.1 four helix bundle protein [Candidatus Parcubacteria bacterium]
MTQFTNSKKKYDLEERTAKFGENVIDLMKRMPNDLINQRLIPQLVASGGSLGANYCEANEAESKKDFQHKIGICKKETKETMHWLRLLARANPGFSDEFRKLWSEAQELLLIFSKILASSRT